MIRPLGVVAAVLAVAGLVAEDGGYDDGRASFGAWVVPVPLELQEQYDLVPGEGGMVVHVRDDRTADQLGLQPGDIVLDINGTPITSSRDIRPIVRAASPGEAVEVTAIVDGNQRGLEGTFAERPPRPAGVPGMWNRGNGPWNGPRLNWPPRSTAEIVADQRAQLAAEKQALDAAETDLADLQKAIASASEPGRSAAWHFTFSCAVEDTL